MISHIFKISFIFICLFGLLLFVGCSSFEESSKVDDQTEVVDEHAGHDHAAGEGHDPEPLVVVKNTSELDWCALHTVPESVCTQCNPSLIDAYKQSGDWCGPHDIPESQCRLCNPGITFPQEEVLRSQANSTTNTNLDWCREHTVPESACTQCNTSLIASFKETGDWCGPHDIPESHCRLCNPGITFPQEEVLRTEAENNLDNEIKVSLFFRENADICATNDAIIQFASAKTADRAGLSTEVVRNTLFESTISAPAETVFDESKSVHVTSTVKTLVSQWLKSPGDNVSEGDVLAILQSPEIAQLKSSLVSKQAAYELQQKELARHKELHARKLISTSDYDYEIALTEQKRSEMISIVGLLLSAGLTSEDIETVKTDKTMSNTFALRSPFTGVLIERIAQLGQLVEDGGSFALLADPQSMWIEAKLSEKQLRNVSQGQKLYFSSDGQGLNGVAAEIIWTARFLDPLTRTGIVRAKVLNKDHNLQSHEFGRAQIPIQGNNTITLVSKDAVQWEGCCTVVFVKETDSRYRPRKVNILDGEGSYYQVTDGLTQGEEVVVDGAFLLKTELKKTSIGAGCCGIEPIS